MRDVFKLELVLHVSDKGCCGLGSCKSLPPHLLYLGPSVSFSLTSVPTQYLVLCSRCSINIVDFVYVIISFN